MVPAKLWPSLSAFGSAGSAREMHDVVRRVHSAGFEGLWIPESSQPVFSLCTAAALAGSDLHLGTSVAVAFARSPMVAAQAAWMLARDTDGRFTLGLGSQVRAHVERRYSAPFSNPGPRLREYVQAVKAIFRAFRGGPLSFHGDYYSFSLLTPTWAPPAMELPDPGILTAGVRPWMCRMAGETADGLLVHPLNSRSYLDTVVLPAVREGEVRAGRPPGSVALVIPVMTAVSDREEIRSRQREQVRNRLAFYGCTPGYDVVFSSSGWPGVGDELSRLQRAGRQKEMPAVISDEMLDRLAVTSSWDGLPEALAARYGDLASDVVCYSALEHWDDDDASRWQDVTRRFRQMTGGGQTRGMVTGWRHDK